MSLPIAEKLGISDAFRIYEQNTGKKLTLEDLKYLVQNGLLPVYFKVLPTSYIDGLNYVSTPIFPNIHGVNRQIDSNYLHNPKIFVSDAPSKTDDAVTHLGEYCLMRTDQQIADFEAAQSDESALLVTKHYSINASPKASMDIFNVSVTDSGVKTWPHTTTTSYIKKIDLLNLITRSTKQHTKQGPVSIGNQFPNAPKYHDDFYLMTVEVFEKFHTLNNRLATRAEAWSYMTSNLPSNYGAYYDGKKKAIILNEKPTDKEAFLKRWNRYTSLDK